MGIWSTKAHKTGFPGVDCDGAATVTVADHEVPLAAYWRIVAASDSGRSPTEIVDQLMKTTDVPRSGRRLIILIVDSIVENLHLIQGSGFNPTESRRMSRASVVVSDNKPMRFSSFRPSKLSAKPDTSGTWEQLHAAQREEAKAVTEALKALSQSETVRKQMPESLVKPVPEPVVDERVRAALKKHEVVEAEVHKAKKLVKKNRMTMA